MRKRNTSGNTNQDLAAQEVFMIKLYEEYQYLIYSMLLKCGPLSSMAEDLFQEVMVRLIKKVNLLCDLEKPALVSYIARTTEHLIVDTLRKTHKMPQMVTLEEETCDYGASPGMAIESIVIGKHGAERIKEAIGQLSEADREVLVGSCLMGYDRKEIAVRIGCSEGAVPTRLHRARKRLMKQLEERDLYE